MSNWTLIRLIALLLFVLPAAIGCRPASQGGGPSAGGRPGAGGSSELVVLSGSENKTLEPILKRFGDQRRANMRMEYLGSVDIMLRLEDGAPGYDAVWPAHSLWVDLGDRKKQVKHSASIMRSPVVFGVKKSVAQRLGWVGKPVTVSKILSAAEAGRLRFMMTSASQSNSGASAYLGYLYAFAGKPDVLTRAHLQNPKVRDQIRRILGSVNRSSGSSGWLKDLFLQKYDQYDAMVNYEALVIEANQALAAQGREPLYVVYPEDGLTIADSPLGYIDHGDAQKEKLFQQLQEYLLSPEVQREILATGRRVGLAGMDQRSADRALFNPEWGVDVQRVLSPIRFPQASLIREALDLYQVAFRKPSFTVYCLDYSGSMKGQGIEDLRSAMRLLLSPEQSRRYLLQASPRDVTVVIPFNHAPIHQWSVTGNKPEALNGLLAKVNELPADGGTDIYSPVMRAFDSFRVKANLNDYFPAVILMTDGKSNQGAKMPDLTAHLEQTRLTADVPVFAIMFGDASPEQLQEITTHTSGRVFDGRKDLIQAFRDAKGYN